MSDPNPTEKLILELEAELARHRDPGSWNPDAAFQTALTLRRVRKGEAAYKPETPKQREERLAKVRREAANLPEAEAAEMIAKAEAEGQEG